MKGHLRGLRFWLHQFANSLRQLWWPWEQIFRKWPVGLIQVFEKLSQQIFKIFVWFQLIRLGCFWDAVDDSGTLGTMNGVYDFPVLLDNTEASERAIRTFCIGKKNWLFHDSVKGAQASAMIYSISETAKLNGIRPYFYFRHLLTELPEYCDNEGKIEPAKLDDLLPWSEKLPDKCRKLRRWKTALF